MEYTKDAKEKSFSVASQISRDILITCEYLHVIHQKSRYIYTDIYIYKAENSTRDLEIEHLITLSVQVDWCCEETAKTPRFKNRGGTSKNVQETAKTPRFKNREVT